MARFYSNENFPLPVAEYLRGLGHDVLTVLETGKSDQAWPDEAVLDFATQENRAVLTLNRKHFIQLHRTGRLHAGIIVCTVDLDFSRQASAIDDLAKEHSDMRAQLFKITRPPA